MIALLVVAAWCPSAASTRPGWRSSPTAPTGPPAAGHRLRRHQHRVGRRCAGGPGDRGRARAGTRRPGPVPRLRGALRPHARRRVTRRGAASDGLTRLLRPPPRRVRGRRIAREDPLGVERPQTVVRPFESTKSPRRGSIGSRDRPGPAVVPLDQVVDLVEAPALAASARRWRARRSDGSASRLRSASSASSWSAVMASISRSLTM